MLFNKKSLAADDETNKEQHATVSILTRCFDSDQEAHTPIIFLHI